MPNRLARSASPYLLQHADNPVDWQEWGDAAFAEAAERDVPVLLSIGYAACHWCHVMAHESFEDEATAEAMNSRFVNVKVDREERPDVDRIYMDATQAMTGRGGWPMTVFLTPDRKPFFAGTYFPKESRHGMPSFTTILDAISDAWLQRRDDVESQAQTLTDAVTRSLPTGTADADYETLRHAYERIAGNFDPAHGGFGGAPKFPQAPTLEFLLRMADDPLAPQAKRMLRESLQAMASGGIYDHLGGGFARYAVDRHWLVPHFEKMLYDNALLARLYLRAWQVVGDDGFRRVATETLDYLIRDMTLPGGAIASSEDADSEGEEGTFYTWTYDEFVATVGDGAEAATAHFGVTPEGNFEGKTVLSIVAADVDPVAIAEAKQRLLEARSQRVRPGRDDKAVASWNGLAMRAFAEAALVLDDQRYLDAAQGIAAFVTTDMRRSDGRLLRSRRDGVGAVPAFCEDYGAVVLGLLALNGADGDDRWLRIALELGEDMVRLFAGPNGFFATGADAEELIARPLDLMDNPTPSGNSLAAEALLALAGLTGRTDLEEAAVSARRSGGVLMAEHPSAVGHLLAVAHTALADPRELAIVGPRNDAATAALASAAASVFRPDLVVARSDGDVPPVPLFEGRLPATQPLAYLCRNFACDAPTSDPVQLRVALDS